MAAHGAAFFVCVWAEFHAVRAGRPAAELIVTNAKVWTGDKAQPTAEALAVISGRIVAVGSAAEIDQWRGTRTTLVDGRGKLLVPGFNDAHVHFFSEAQSWTMSI